MHLLAGAEGADAPLTLTLSHLEEGGGKHQRLLAYGVVPPGSYRGVAVQTIDGH